MAGQSPRPGPKAGGALVDARARDEAERRDRHRNDELSSTCADLEENLEMLKSRFDLYFLGVERREPAREREEMRRAVARLKGEVTRNTGLRFRIETLHARFLSYDRMWTRSARQKEEGTYRRDLLRVKRQKQRDTESSPAPAGPSDERGASPAPSAPAVERPRPTAASPAARDAAPALPPGISAEQLRALYGAYVEAKKRCNEDVSRLSYDALAKTVSRQVPELIAKYKARSVEFKVVIKDGRAVLKAVPKV